MPNSFHGNRIWRLHHNGFGLINFLSFILLIRFLAILDSLDGGHVSNRQSNAYIYIYIYIYLYICLLRLTNECPWNSRLFMTLKIVHPWRGWNLRSLDYIPNSIDSRHVSDHQSNASQIYFYISGAPKQEIVYENDKIWIADDSHFEFYD